MSGAGDERSRPGRDELSRLDPDAAGAPAGDELSRLDPDAAAAPGGELPVDPDAAARRTSGRGRSRRSRRRP